MLEINKAIVCLHTRQITRFLLVIVGCATLLAGEFEYAQSEVADPAAVIPLGLKVMNEKVPPGGMLQLKLSVTEPKPILKGNQRVRYASAFLGPVRGIHLFSPAGDVIGVAVLENGDAQVYFSSPLNSFGTNLDYPVLTIAMWRARSIRVPESRTKVFHSLRLVEIRTACFLPATVSDQHKLTRSKLAAVIRARRIRAIASALILTLGSATCHLADIPRQKFRALMG